MPPLKGHSFALADAASRHGSFSTIQAEFGVQLGLRISSSPDIELFRFNDPFFLERAPELQLIRAELKVHGLLRACCQIYPLKSFQLAHWPRGTAGALVYVKLNHGVAGPVAGIRHVNRN